MFRFLNGRGSHGVVALLLLDDNPTLRIFASLRIRVFERKVSKPTTLTGEDLPPKTSPGNQDGDRGRRD